MTYVTDGKRHLVCLPYSVENLHLMAEQLGIKRCWFHKDHYDIPKKKFTEIENQCMMVSSKEIVRIINGRDIRHRRHSGRLQSQVALHPVQAEELEGVL